MNSTPEWINPVHFSEESVQRFREAFRVSPVGGIYIDDFLVEATADQLSFFLQHGAIYKDVFGTYAHGEVDKEQWGSALEEEKFFYFERMARVGERYMMHAGTLIFLKLRHAIQSGAANGFFNIISGLSCDGCTISHVHRYKREHFLKPHTDNRFGRKIAVIIYLSRNNDCDFGGNLMLSAGGKTEVMKYRFNRLVMFDVTKNTHFIEPFNPPAGSFTRLSMGWWLLERKM